MIALQGLLTVIWFVIIPYILGKILVKKDDENSVLYTILMGTLVQMGIFLIIAIPLILLKKKFLLLRNLYFIVIAIICLMIVLLKRKNLIKFSKPKKVSLFQIIAFILVGVQVFIRVKYTTINNDDSSFVVLSSQMIETGKMYYSEEESLNARRALAPISAYYAVVSEFLFTHVVIVTHTVIPIIYTILANIVYYYLGKALFKDDEESSYIFLIFLALGNFYLFKVKGAGSYFVRFTWLGRTIVAGMLLPLFWKISLDAMNKEKNKIKDWLSILFIVLSSCLCSEMAIAIVTIPIAVMALVNSIRDKKFSYLLKAFGTIIPCLILALIYIKIR